MILFNLYIAFLAIVSLIILFISIYEIYIASKSANQVNDTSNTQNISNSNPSNSISVILNRFCGRILRTNNNLNDKLYRGIFYRQGFFLIISLSVSSWIVSLIIQVFLYNPNFYSVMDVTNDSILFLCYYLPEILYYSTLTFVNYYLHYLYNLYYNMQVSILQYYLIGQVLILYIALTVSYLLFSNQSVLLFTFLFLIIKVVLLLYMIYTGWNIFLRLPRINFTHIISGFHSSSNLQNLVNSNTNQNSLQLEQQRKSMILIRFLILLVLSFASLVTSISYDIKYVHNR